VCAHGDCTPVSVSKVCLMCEKDDNRYDRGNHGYDANPETAHAKPAIFDSHLYFLTLLGRLIIQRNAACWPGTPYWFHFSLRELEPSAELLPPMAGNLAAAEQ
jgi:hypothetical protein